MFSYRSCTTWSLIASLPLYYLLRMGQNGLYQTRVTLGCRPVSRGKLMRSSGSSTVPFVRARTPAPLPSSCMKFTCGTVWGQLPPSIMPLSPIISWICCCPCLCSGTHLGCQPLPRPALRMCQLLRKLVPLTWMPLVTLHLHYCFSRCLYQYTQPLSLILPSCFFFRNISISSASVISPLSCLQILAVQMPSMCVAVGITFLLLWIFHACTWAYQTSLIVVLVWCLHVPSIDPWSNVNRFTRDSHFLPCVGCIPAWWFWYSCLDMTSPHLLFI